VSIWVTSLGRLLPALKFVPLSASLSTTLSPQANPSMYHPDAFLSPGSLLNPDLSLEVLGKGEEV
jgi:hypothetical protein